VGRSHCPSSPHLNLSKELPGSRGVLANQCSVKHGENAACHSPELLQTERDSRKVSFLRALWNYFPVWIISTGMVGGSRRTVLCGTPLEISVTLSRQLCSRVSCHDCPHYLRSKIFSGWTHPRKITSDFTASIRQAAVATIWCGCRFLLYFRSIMRRGRLEASDAELASVLAERDATDVGRILRQQF